MPSDCERQSLHGVERRYVIGDPNVDRSLHTAGRRLPRDRRRLAYPTNSFETRSSRREFDSALAVTGNHNTAIASALSSSATAQIGDNNTAVASSPSCTALASGGGATDSC